IQLRLGSKLPSLRILLPPAGEGVPDATPFFSRWREKDSAACPRAGGGWRSLEGRLLTGSGPDAGAAAESGRGPVSREERTVSPRRRGRSRRAFRASASIRTPAFRQQ